MTPFLFNHLWQSTLVLGAIGLLTLSFRNNGAQVRHALWTAASLKFLFPFALLNELGMALAGLLGLQLPSLPVFEVLSVAGQPFTQRPLPASAAWLLPAALLWGAGVLAVAAFWLSRWQVLRAGLHAARDTGIAAPMTVKISATPLEPGLVGIFRPVMLLPEGIVSRLSAAELAAIIAHESCHLRRRDNLWAAAHMLVQALFWFWPPVWWLGARLVAERERACDEAVLAAGNDPQTYAQSILKVCKFYVSSPLACAAGIAGADLGKRMETIMENRVVAGLNGVKMTLLGGAAAALLLLPVAAGLWSAAQAQGAACTPGPVMRTHTLPPYPVVSAMMGEVGTVLLQVTVARDGHVAQAVAARGSGFNRLDEAAVSHVRQYYTWLPSACGPVQTNVRVVFALASPAAARQSPK